MGKKNWPKSAKIRFSEAPCSGASEAQLVIFNFKTTIYADIFFKIEHFEKYFRKTTIYVQFFFKIEHFEKYFRWTLLIVYGIQVGT